MFLSRGAVLKGPNQGSVGRTGSRIRIFPPPTITNRTWHIRTYVSLTSSQLNQIEAHESSGSTCQ
jgi:hypothetical protein